MGNKDSYQIFKTAIEILVTNSGRDKDKIKSAFLYILPRIKKENLPESSHENFEFILSKLTDENKIDEWEKNLPDRIRLGILQHCLGSLSPHSIKKIKKCMWEIFCDLDLEFRR